MPVPYRCLYNHELLILFTTRSPYQTYRENVKPEQATGYVRELKGTAVDALMICPTAWKMPLYVSDVDPRWKELKPAAEPLPESDWRYGDKVYWRVRRYMATGADPVELSVRTANECGITPFISYRMNEMHYNEKPDYPTHSDFWRSNYRTKGLPNGGLDYSHPEVRDWYTRILFELIDKYDVGGIELDFCRFPSFFPESKAIEHMPLMTDLVRGIRKKLDDTARARGRELALCVRVPRSIDAARGIGLDVASWCRAGVVDMLNVSPFAFFTADIGIEEYKRHAGKVPVYGEMQFNTFLGETPWHFRQTVFRHTTKAMYETAAYDFLKRGADGVSFFNFCYTRDHSFSDPRLKRYPGTEPPFDILSHITDCEYLADRPKHYMLPRAPWPANCGENTSGIPARLSPGVPVPVRLHIADDMNAGHSFIRAMLRLESDSDIVGHDLEVVIAGKKCAPTFGPGELFPPQSANALPRYENLLFYDVPLSVLTQGMNEFSLESRAPREWSKWHIDIIGMELALYR
ncbi:MAG: hypothetical protein AABZ39_13680 [Spirochaetota bacterium]